MPMPMSMPIPAPMPMPMSMSMSMPIRVPLIPRIPMIIKVTTTKPKQQSNLQMKLNMFPYWKK
jgi:hypothetical protein